MTEVGIIGFGSFGRFISMHLKKNFDIFVSDKIDKSAEADSMGIKFVSVKEAASKEIIILSVPISSLKSILNEIKDSLSDNSIVLDVCSVKTMPCKWMKEILPINIEIIGTHPLFGPQSGRNGIIGLKIVICPVRAKDKTILRVNNMFINIGLDIIKATPIQHDKAMANSHALLHFITLPMINLGMKDQKIKISALNKVLELIDIFKEDSFELFINVQIFNPEAKKLRKRFIDELMNLDKKLDSMENSFKEEDNSGNR